MTTDHNIAVLDRLRRASYIWLVSILLLSALWFWNNYRSASLEARINDLEGRIEVQNQIIDAYQMGILSSPNHNKHD